MAPWCMHGNDGTTTMHGNGGTMTMHGIDIADDEAMHGELVMMADCYPSSSTLLHGDVC